MMTPRELTGRESSVYAPSMSPGEAAERFLVRAFGGTAILHQKWTIDCFTNAAGARSWRVAVKLPNGDAWSALMHSASPGYYQLAEPDFGLGAIEPGPGLPQGAPAVVVAIPADSSCEVKPRRVVDTTDRVAIIEEALRERKLKREVARDTARAVGGAVAVPDFGAQRPDDATDFNDLARLRGPDAVRACIEAASVPSEAPALKPVRAGTAVRDGVRDGRPVLDAGQRRPARTQHPNAAAPIEPGAGASADASPSERDTDAEIKRLAKLSPIAYERERAAAAERLGLRASMLDRQVTRERDGNRPVQGAALVLADPEPAAEPVALSELLDSLSDAITRHVILPAHGADAVALWTAATWTIEHADCAPILLVRSPMPRCGKTTLMDALGELVRRSLPAASITPAALFRTIEKSAPTLLIDEGDAFLAGSDDLRGVINSGHTRATAYVIRTVGDDHEPRRFGTFGAKAIALIGRAAETISDRAIAIELRRRMPSESVTKLRRPARAALHVLRAGLARWAIDCGHRTAGAEPHLPDELHDRAADSWTPLLAIADMAGGDWPQRARSAALALSGGVESPSAGAELLADVRAIFERRGVDRISGADLLADLLADEERPWATYNKGRPLSQSQLARKLSAFGVSSRSVRLPDGRTPKGYLRENFEDAFVRYLPFPGSQSATPAQASTGAGCGAFAKRNSETVLHFEKAPQASTGAGCAGVALSDARNSDFASDAVPDADREVV